MDEIENLNYFRGTFFEKAKFCRNQQNYSNNARRYNIYIVNISEGFVNHYELSNAAFTPLHFE